MLDKYKIAYLLIPSGMTPYCQPLDISVNKSFKDNIKILFEKDRLIMDNINPKIKLNSLRLNIINYNNKVWSDPFIIIKDIIRNGFIKACLIDNNYKSIDEEKIMDNYFFDLNLGENIEIIDDIAKELNINTNNFLEEGEEDDEFEDEISKSLTEHISLEPNNKINDNYKMDLENMEK